MIYVIPAWYDGQLAAGGFGYISCQGRQREKYEFDDAVHQMRMLQSAGEHPVLLSLSYAPTLRHILHRQGLYPMPVRSAFDLLQGVSVRQPVVRSFRDYPWPPGMEWSYNPFAVLGFAEGRMYVRIRFGEDGNFSQADYYDENRRICRTEYFDDRGFRSAAIRYGVAVGEGPGRTLQEFYDPAGERRMIQDLSQGSVQLFGETARRMGRVFYPSMGELLRETLQQMTADLAEEDVILAAADDRHDAITAGSAGRAALVCSFFADRSRISGLGWLGRGTDRVKLLLADTAETAAALQEAMPQGRQIPVYDAMPFDVRLPIGRSQRQKTVQILLPVDGLPEEAMRAALSQIYRYMWQHPRIQLLAMTRHPQRMGWIREVLSQARPADHQEELGVDAGEAPGDAGENRDIAGEDMAGAGEEAGERVKAILCTSEGEIIHYMRGARLLVDLRERPTLYLQIAALSAAIPQINARQTKYAVHGENGYTVRSMEQLYDGLTYFLSSLTNWNAAMVHCVKMRQSHTAKAFTQRLKELIKRHE